jgi:hypothetical protein
VTILTSLFLVGIAKERLNVALKANDNMRAACMWCGHSFFTYLLCLLLPQPNFDRRLKAHFLMGMKRAEFGTQSYCNALLC